MSCPHASTRRFSRRSHSPYSRSARGAPVRTASRPPLDRVPIQPFSDRPSLRVRGSTPRCRAQVVAEGSVRLRSRSTASPALMPSSSRSTSTTTKHHIDTQYSTCRAGLPADAPAPSSYRARPFTARPARSRSRQRALRLQLARSRSLSLQRLGFPPLQSPSLGARSPGTLTLPIAPPRCRSRPCSKRHPRSHLSMRAPCPTRERSTAAARARRGADELDLPRRSRTRLRCPIPRCSAASAIQARRMTSSTGIPRRPAAASLQHRSRCGAPFGRSEERAPRQQV